MARGQPWKDSLLTLVQPGRAALEAAAGVVLVMRGILGETPHPADVAATVSARRAVAAQAVAAETAPPPAVGPQDSPNDVVVVGACRTASTRARKGGFKDATADSLVMAEVNDVCLGSVFPASSKRANEVRTALLLAGFPPSVPAYTVNRQCAAGLQAIANVAADIRAGFYSIGIAGGVETLTRDPLDWQGSDNPRVQESQDAQDVKLPLGLTAENVAERFSVPRDLQDRLAASSHAKAAAAQAAGRFKDEIVPVETTVQDASGEARRVSVDSDDGIRPDSTADKLAQLKPYFKKGGTVTVGNACQNTDCAAAVMLMTRREAQRRGLPVMATLRSFATVGVPPGIMGTAPTKAIPAALHKAGLSKDDIDMFELNEAFASQFAYCLKELGLDEEKVNPNGGAIALGHPAGATGARQTVTLLHEMARRNSNGAGGNGKGARYGMVSMCTGSGMGAAAVFESGDSSGSFSSGSTSSASLGSVASADAS
ncbi:hypothetical protein CHLNCDRAFT_143855 [Chlorella variabilis]|uniref:acetyl-CoA C-acyltransferase n=1 Tax=Chlorella variabilis TaxID=554065 RepID=E1ZAL2_CHLVA|nr:hypothetical protein CHLNCDRAFT_143855 [Chlorella variabilis]EFN57082.1 hypothetical protein CHLNCDRAFT_143855 [Chlorella variabilis]|eukprot:XP_005849184.1 hypothetical protein CHLNCDRAFT_143855 [Chlorella variabilis]